MQSTDIFSVGGSISVNAHGMDHQAGARRRQPFESMRVMLAEARSTVLASRERGPVPPRGRRLRPVRRHPRGRARYRRQRRLPDRARDHPTTRNFRRCSPARSRRTAIRPDSTATSRPRRAISSKNAALHATTRWPNRRRLQASRSTSLGRQRCGGSPSTCQAGRLLPETEMVVGKAPRDRIRGTCTVPRTQAMGGRRPASSTATTRCTIRCRICSTTLADQTDILHEYFIPRQPSNVSFVDGMRKVLTDNKTNRAERVGPRRPQGKHRADLFAGAGLSRWCSTSTRATTMGQPADEEGDGGD